MKMLGIGGPRFDAGLRNVPGRYHPPAGPDRLWYALRTRPFFIEELAGQCENIGALMYYPVFARRIRPGRSRRSQVVYAPAFPGYGFIPIDDAVKLRRLPHDRYQIVRTSPQAFVHLGEKTVRAIAEQEEAWCAVEPEQKPVHRFSVGDRVKLVGDIFDQVMTVTGIVGNTVRMEADSGYEWRADPAWIQRIASEDVDSLRNVG